MELMLKDGDYVPDGNGGLKRAEGSDALLQRVLWLLTVRRGSFPFLPNLGSRLYLLPREKAASRSATARQYVEEALAAEEGLICTGVTLAAGENGRAELMVTLEHDGETLQATLTVTG